MNSILAFALNCWTCDSISNPDCSDPVQLEKKTRLNYAKCLSDDTLQPVFCVKITKTCK